jgi:uncharacterized protein (DUF433 family)
VRRFESCRGRSCEAQTCDLPGYQQAGITVSGWPGKLHPGGACLTPQRHSGHDEVMDLHGIAIDHRVMGGVPCVAGTRIPVATPVGMIANGLSTDEILAEYPQLAAADIQACLAYAARAVDAE